MTRYSPYPGRLLRPRKVSQLLDVTVRHVYRLIHQGDLEAVRIGPRIIRVTRESLDDYLQIVKRDSPARTNDTNDLRSSSPGWRERRTKSQSSEKEETTPVLRGVPRLPYVVNSGR